MSEKRHGLTRKMVTGRADVKHDTDAVQYPNGTCSQHTFVGGVRIIFGLLQEWIRFK